MPLMARLRNDRPFGSPARVSENRGHLCAPPGATATVSEGESRYQVQFPRYESVGFDLDGSAPVVPVPGAVLIHDVIKLRGR